MKLKLLSIGGFIVWAALVGTLTTRYGLWATLLGAGMAVCGATFMYEISYAMWQAQDKVIQTLKRKLEQHEEIYDSGWSWDDE